MLGFGLCVAGAYLIGYSQSLRSTAGIADGWITKYAGILGVSPSPGYLANLLGQTNSYIQQNVTAVWADYLAIGIVMAICGAILVAAGDRKAKKP